VAHDGYTGGAARAKMAAANEAILTIALIESARGIDHAAEIVATPGLDVVWLGHYDLSDSLGCVENFDDPRYREAVGRLVSAAQRAHMPLGWLVMTGEDARAAVAQGFRCICIGHEAAILRNALARELARARQDAPVTDAITGRRGDPRTSQNSKEETP
jgi:2-keto-3-deoxy-L-rhamnonate aldolase RhmA